MKKRSLHVGLNYPGTSAELAGCVNDAFDWADMLGGLGYQATLLEEPTAVEILAALRGAMDGLRWGDRFVFTYSGHGSFVPDRDGDEVDGFDEVLCPRDFERNVVTDDQLAAAFGAAARGVRRTFLSDSCHSGTISRFFDPNPAVNGRKVRFLPPSNFLPESQLRGIMTDRMITPRANITPAVLISGCADAEYSYDAWFGRRANGAFTRVAVDAYRPGDTMLRWFKAIRSGLPNNSFPQRPQLTTNLHQRYWKF